MREDRKKTWRIILSTPSHLDKEYILEKAANNLLGKKQQQDVQFSAPLLSVLTKDINRAFSHVFYKTYA